jgi:hypothetical protein
MIIVMGMAIISRMNCGEVCVGMTAARAMWGAR